VAEAHNLVRLSQKLRRFSLYAAQLRFDEEPARQSLTGSLEWARCPRMLLKGLDARSFVAEQLTETQAIISAKVNSPSRHYLPTAPLRSESIADAVVGLDRSEG